MPLLTNSIDNFHFLVLTGEIIPPMQSMDIEQRPGVNGIEIAITARKGKPFTMISRADTQNYAECADLVDQYQRLIGGAPVEIVQGNVASTSFGFSVSVLNVQAVRAVALSGGIGGLSGPQPRGLLEARWDLIAISDSQPDDQAPPGSGE
jgi:hypothetical protein